MSVQHHILNGPGKSDLMFGLFDNKVLTFNVHYGEIKPFESKRAKRIIPSSGLRINIIGLQAKDGSSCQWNFTGINHRTKEKIAGEYDHNTKKGFFTNTNKN